MRTLILSVGLVALLLVPDAGAQAQQSSTNSSTAESIGADVEAHLADIEETLARARRGDLGRMRRSVQDNLRDLGNQITAMLQGHNDARSLTSEQQHELDTAQKAFDAIVENQGDSMVCEQVARIGTRMTSARCMTVTEWDIARRNSREATEQMHRNTGCIEGAGNCTGL